MRSWGGGGAPQAPQRALYPWRMASGQGWGAGTEGDQGLGRLAGCRSGTQLRVSLRCAGRRALGLSLSRTAPSAPHAAAAPAAAPRRTAHRARRAAAMRAAARAAVMRPITACRARAPAAWRSRAPTELRGLRALNTLIFRDSGFMEPWSPNFITALKARVPAAWRAPTLWRSCGALRLVRV